MHVPTWDQAIEKAKSKGDLRMVHVLTTAKNTAMTNCAVCMPEFYDPSVPTQCLLANGDRATQIAHEAGMLAHT